MSSPDQVIRNRRDTSCQPGNSLEVRVKYGENLSGGDPQVEEGEGEGTRVYYLFHIGVLLLCWKE